MPHKNHIGAGWWEVETTYFVSIEQKTNAAFGTKKTYTRY